MATRGRKPKSPHLKAVTGNPGKRKVSPDPPAQSRRATPLEPLKKLTKVQQRLWDRLVEPAWWLTEFDVAKAQMWVIMFAEYLAHPKECNTPRVNQIRMLATELGLDPGERARRGIETEQEDDPTEGFFD